VVTVVYDFGHVCLYLFDDNLAKKVTNVCSCVAELPSSTFICTRRMAPQTMHHWWSGLRLEGILVPTNSCKMSVGMNMSIFHFARESEQKTTTTSFLKYSFVRVH